MVSIPYRKIWSRNITGWGKEENSVSIPYRKIWSLHCRQMHLHTLHVSIPYRKIWSVSPLPLYFIQCEFPFLTGKFEARPFLFPVGLSCRFPFLTGKFEAQWRYSCFQGVHMFPFLTGKFEACQEMRLWGLRMSFHSLQENLKRNERVEAGAGANLFPFLTGKFEAELALLIILYCYRFHSLQENLKRCKGRNRSYDSREVSIPYRKIWSSKASVPVGAMQVFPFLTGKFEAPWQNLKGQCWPCFHSLQENLKQERKDEWRTLQIRFHSLQENLKRVLASWDTESFSCVSIPYRKIWSLVAMIEESVPDSFHSLQENLKPIRPEAF